MSSTRSSSTRSSSKRTKSSTKRAKVISRDNLGYSISATIKNGGAKARSTVDKTNDRKDEIKYDAYENVQAMQDGVWYEATLLDRTPSGRFNLVMDIDDLGYEKKRSSDVRKADDFRVGQMIEGQYRKGKWYPAIILEKNSGGTFTLEWRELNGFLGHSIKTIDEIRNMSTSQLTIESERKKMRTAVRRSKVTAVEESQRNLALALSGSTSQTSNDSVQGGRQGSDSDLTFEALMGGGDADLAFEAFMGGGDASRFNSASPTTPRASVPLLVPESPRSPQTAGSSRRSFASWS